MPLQPVMQNQNSDGRPNSYQNQKPLQEINISWEIKWFLSIFQGSNHCKPIPCLEMHTLIVAHLLMHLQGMVLVCGDSMVTEKGWNKLFTMKSTRTCIYHNILNYLSTRTCIYHNIFNYLSTRICSYHNISNYLCFICLTHQIKQSYLATVIHNGMHHCFK